MYARAWHNSEMTYAWTKNKLPEIERESLLLLLNQIKMQTNQIKALNKKKNHIVVPLETCF